MYTLVLSLLAVTPVQLDFPLLDAAGKKAILTTYRVLNAGTDGKLAVDTSPFKGYVQPAASPLPAGWIRAQTVLNQGETVVLRAANGKKIKSIITDRSGIVRFKPIDPWMVFMTGEEVGRVKITVVTQD